MELVLIRHAEPHQVDFASEGADPELTPRGHLQAKELASWLARERIDSIVASPLRRAQQTADPLIGAHAEDAITTREGLAEYDRGASAYTPIEVMRNTDHPHWAAIDRGELYGVADPQAYIASTVAAVEEIISENPNGRVAVVTHGGVINVYLGHILGISRPLWFEPSYASICRVMASRTGRRMVKSLNEIPPGNVGLV